MILVEVLLLYLLTEQGFNHNMSAISAIYSRAPAHFLVKDQALELRITSSELRTRTFFHYLL